MRADGSLDKRESSLRTLGHKALDCEQSRHLFRPLVGGSIMLLPERRESGQGGIVNRDPIDNI
jgi:hypothetical protein